MARRARDGRRLLPSPPTPAPAWLPPSLAELLRRRSPLLLPPLSLPPSSLGAPVLSLHGGAERAAMAGRGRGHGGVPSLACTRRLPPSPPGPCALLLPPPWHASWSFAARRARGRGGGRGGRAGPSPRRRRLARAAGAEAHPCAGRRRWRSAPARTRRQGRAAMDPEARRGAPVAEATPPPPPPQLRCAGRLPRRTAALDRARARRQAPPPLAAGQGKARTGRRQWICGGAGGGRRVSRRRRSGCRRLRRRASRSFPCPSAPSRADPGGVGGPRARRADLRWLEHPFLSLRPRRPRAPLPLSLQARRPPPLLMELDGRGGALRRRMREDDGVQRLVAGPMPRRRVADGRYRASFGARESCPQR